MSAMDTVVIVADGIVDGLVTASFNPDSRVMSTHCNVCGESARTVLIDGQANSSTLRHEDWCKVLLAAEALHRGNVKSSRRLWKQAKAQLHIKH